jgi:hypothetical protein
MKYEDKRIGNYILVTSPHFLKYFKYYIKHEYKNFAPYKRYTYYSIINNPFKGFSKFTSFQMIGKVKINRHESDRFWVFVKYK